MRKFSFLVKGDGIKWRLHVRSKHLQGAIRKLYQQYDFDEIVAILN